MNESSDAFLPLFALRDTVLDAGVTLPLFVGRPATKAAIEAAAQHGNRLVAIAQRRVDDPEPTQAGLHDVGTIAEVAKVWRLPDGTWKVELAGLGYARLLGLEDATGYRRARVRPVDAATDAERGVPAPKGTIERPDDVIAEGSFEGFDPAGDPGWSRERCGTINVIFEDLPPSWFAGTEAEELAFLKSLDRGIAAAVQTPTLWDNHQTLMLEQPRPDAVERLRAFLTEFRARHATRS